MDSSTSKKRVLSPAGTIVSASSRTPSLQRTQSSPVISHLNQLNLTEDRQDHNAVQRFQKLNISGTAQPNKGGLKKRIMTVPANLSAYHHPSIVLELLLSLPMECHLGIGVNLRPMIDRAIHEQTLLEQQQEAPPRRPKLPHDPQPMDRFHHHSLYDDDNGRDFEHQQMTEILPAAPMAIPPTAPTMALKDSLERVPSTDDLNAMLNDIGKSPSPRGPRRGGMRRPPSIKQFESVLQEGYTAHLMVAVMQSLCGAFLTGYNTSVLNVPSSLIMESCALSETHYASLQSFFCLGGLIGALSIGKIADKFGRKIAIFIFDLVFIAAGLLAFSFAMNWFGDRQSPSMFPLFAASRGLCGVGAGIATAIIPTYLGEISPPLIRGAIGTLNQMTVCMGLVVAEIMGYSKLFGNLWFWPWLFAFNVALPLLQIATFWSFPESPKWLITKGKEEKARRVLQHLRECSNVDMDLHFTKLANEFQKRKRTYSRSALHTVHTVSERDQLLNGNGDTEHDQRYGSTQHVQVVDNVQSVRSPRKDQIEIENRALGKVIRISICIAMGLQVLQQFSGINSVFFYSNATLMNAGFDSVFELWLGNVAIAVANFLSVLLPVYLMDKWGRKQLLNISLMGMIVSSIGFSICVEMGYNYLSVIFLILYVISFELGVGPIPWLMMAEISPSSHRAVIVSVATFCNWGSNLCIAQFATVIVERFQYYPFAVVCFVGVVAVKKFVPETKGKTEMQIQEELLSR